jgi:hypothetical protein
MSSCISVGILLTPDHGGLSGRSGPVARHVESAIRCHAAPNTIKMHATCRVTARGNQGMRPWPGENNQKRRLTPKLGMVKRRWKTRVVLRSAIVRRQLIRSRGLDLLWVPSLP